MGKGPPPGAGVRPGPPRPASTPAPAPAPAPARPVSAPARLRPAWADIDLGAVRHNAALLADLVAPAALCAVVKADAYGHGALEVSRAALQGGARWLAVALVEEGVALREGGISAPVLVLSEPPRGSMESAVAHGLVPTVYSPDGVRAAAVAAERLGVRAEVHIKVDTGMHRVGADPADLGPLVELVAGSPALSWGGLWTHLAVAEAADGDDCAFTDSQLDRFAVLRDDLRATGAVPTVVHAANSAAAIARPAARLDLVRCGIALYGVLPDPGLGPVLEAGSGGAQLEPVMSLKARVSWVRELEQGERPSYGRLRPLAERSVVATVPIGYADGVPRRFFTGGGTVLVGGRPRPLAGAVTMDQIVVDCGPGAAVAVGDEVVLIGSQGTATVTAQDWAEVLGTIGYEVVTGISGRVPRVMVDNAAGGGGEGT